MSAVERSWCCTRAPAPRGSARVEGSCCVLLHDLKEYLTYVVKKEREREKHLCLISQADLVEYLNNGIMRTDFVASD